MVTPYLGAISMGLIIMPAVQKPVVALPSVRQVTRLRGLALGWSRHTVKRAGRRSPAGIQMVRCSLGRGGGPQRARLVLAVTHPEW